MNQNIKLIIIIVVILLTSFIYNKIKPERKVVRLKKEIIYNDGNQNNSIDGKVNVNIANIENYLKVGITLNIAKKLVEYKEIVGRIESLDEFIRISGIGVKSVEKLTKNIVVGDGGELNKLKINSASIKTLKYYGFTNKEIKKINGYIKKNDVIYSNIEMIEVLGEKRYRGYEDMLEYN